MLISFTDDYRELDPNPYGILKGVVDSKSFRKGSWGAEIVDQLKPQAKDIVIEGKRGLDGFASTNLDFILRARGIENIALVVFTTTGRIHHAHRLRERLSGRHAEGLHRDPERRGAASGRREELSDVLPAAHA